MIRESIVRNDSPSEAPVCRNQHQYREEIQLVLSIVTIGLSLIFKIALKAIEVNNADVAISSGFINHDGDDIVKEFTLNLGALRLKVKI